MKMVCCDALFFMQKATRVQALLLQRCSGLGSSWTGGAKCCCRTSSMNILWKSLCKVLTRCTWVRHVQFGIHFKKLFARGVVCCFKTLPLDETLLRASERNELVVKLRGKYSEDSTDLIRPFTQRFTYELNTWLRQCSGPGLLPFSRTITLVLRS
ncbi:hypothetical protein METBIDRAFT_90446 [Metschnikowia bicuspidata var. bicuspidata NRRL YB-4993]|uniref:Uncharacterized protein n=1 Tax=Metschnikowia bicuspidata var. bicuspidata NRRL YB-4993 TaxID=869754 RepID=A0A1A0HEZ9_9ASCO|nr:hypothetical protein METBIDRAFT_90446 [Metschnikowia bicuspidata var. bicuspidata NRRL YB-4993]OBA22699.1 hypothetical protein METBIDRAFT_90446 [Metschnikowia bicuspidata var. bicuspidata NRRL YB-4993]